MKTLFSIATVALCTTAAVPAMAALRQVAGTITFEDATFSTNGLPAPGGTTTSLGFKPVRSVAVTLKVAGSTVGSATTSSAGTYSVWIDDSKLPVGGQLKVELQSKNYASNVYLDMDWFNDRLTWTNQVTIPSGSAAIALDKAITIGDFSHHFNIVDAIHRGRQYADARREGGDDIGTVELEYPDADWSHYNSFWGDITLSGYPAHGYGGDAGEHGWSDGTIIHEYGHHLEYEISDVDTGGGEHTTCTDNGWGFAWAEGWATYFAGAVRASNAAGALNGGFGNLETKPGCAAPAAEAFTSATMWDLDDGLGGAAEPSDRVNGNQLSGAKPIRDILFGVFDTEQDDTYYSGQFLIDPTTSLHSFHNHLVNRNLYAGAHADIDRVYANHGVLPHALSDYSIPTIGVSPSTNIIAGKTVNLTITMANPGPASYTDENLLVRIVTNPGPGDIVLDSFTTAAFTGTKTVTRVVTMPSTLAQQTHFVLVYVDPLDRFPETVENNNVLAVAVPVVVCGNGTCSAGESCSTCAADCGSCCGNGACSGSETCQSCPGDCGACTGCGDGFCIGNETSVNCPDDCGIDDGGTCFAAGTPITMADGTHKPIEEVRDGDTVLSFDTGSGRLVEGRVVRTFVHEDSDRLVVVDGTLVTTAMHRFWADGRWVAADELDVGSRLLRVADAADPAASLATEAAPVSQIEARDGRITTFNFEVAGWHDYFAGGVLVHNIKKSLP